MEVMTRKGSGLFPTPVPISLDCSCPDYADMCKHVAAVLYGVGARLDEKPELLFLLRKVDHMDLLAHAGDAPVGRSAAAKEKVLATGDLSGLFGIELEAAASPAPAAAKTKKASKTTKASKARKKKATTITAKELVAQGVSRSLIQTWLRSGVLTATSTRGVYGRTGEVERRLVARREATVAGG
jgi:uncharacterized Zn finger protein